MRGLKAAGCWAERLSDYANLKGQLCAGLESRLVAVGPEEGCLTMPGLKAAGCHAGELSVSLKADCVPGWRAVGLPLGLKAD